MLKVGDKLKAKFSDNLSDKVTKGNLYEVTKVTHRLGQTTFRIINDEGEEVFPIWVGFEKVGD
jgi:hypothetical protein